MSSRKKQENEEVKNLQQRAELADLLFLFYYGAKDVEEQKDKINKAYELINRIVYVNPYISFKKLPELVSYENLEGDTLGQYQHFFETVVIDYKLVVDVFLDDKKPLSDILNTIGHELRHCYQEDIYIYANDKNLTREQRLKALSMNPDSNMLEPDEIHIIFCMAKAKGNKEVEAYFKLDKEEQDKVCKFIKDAIYFNLEIEKDARKAGIIFAEGMINSWLNDPMIDKIVKAKLKKELSYISQSRENESEMFSKIQNNPYYKMFNNIVSSFEDLPNLATIGDVVRTNTFMRRDMNDVEKEKYKKMVEKINKKTYNARNFILNQNLKNQDIDATIHLLFDCIEAGSSYFHDCFNEFINHRDYTDAYKKDVKNHIIDMLKYVDISGKTFRLFNEIINSFFSKKSVLSVKEYQEVIESLLEQEKLIFATSMSRNIVGCKSPYFACVKNKIIKTCRNYLKQDRLSRSTFHHINSFFEDVGLDLNEEHYNFMEQEEEYLYLKKNYGSIFANEDRSAVDQILSDLDSYLEEKRRKEKEKSVVPVSNK